MKVTSAKPSSYSPASLLTGPKGRVRLLTLLGIALPIGAFFGYVWCWALYIPYQDDMALIFAVNDFEENPLAKLPGILMEQLNDHRIVFAKLAALISYLSLGYIHFRGLVLAGYANLLLLGYGLYLFFRTTRLPLAYFLPVPFIIFNPYVYQISLWGLVSFQVPLVIAFSLLSLHALYTAMRPAWALVWAVCATFSSGSGLLCFLLGGFLLIVERRYRVLAWWALGFALTMSAYFFEYRFSSATQLPAWSELVGIFLTNLTVFSGSYLRIFSDSKALVMMLLLGATILGLYGLLFLRRVLGASTKAQQTLAAVFPSQANWLLHAGFLTLLATGALIALARSGGGILELASDRFHLYSSAFLALFYLVLVASLSPVLQKWLLRVGLAAAVFSNAYAYLHIEPARDSWYTSLSADAYNYPNHGFFLHQYNHMPDQDSTFYRHCRFPTIFSETTIQRIWQGSAHGENPFNSHLNFSLKRVKTPVDSPIYPMADLVMQLDSGLRLPQTGILMILSATDRPGQVYLVAPWRTRASVIHWLQTGDYYTNTLSVYFPDKLPSGTYGVSLCWKQETGLVPVLNTTHVLKL
ncbi:MAG: hypothetical protein LH606_06265 [Cytophagaceae bacterium]|nr:hypothetical protein [Cytophagaceae bacterium]